MTPEAGMGYYPIIEDDDQYTVEREDAVACRVERAQAEHEAASMRAQQLAAPAPADAEDPS